MRVARVVLVVLKCGIDVLEVAALVAFAPVGIVEALAFASARKSPGVFRVESRFAVTAIKHARNGFRLDAERAQCRIENAQRDQLRLRVAVESRLLRRGHLSVNPRIGHVAANDGESGIFLLFCRNRIRKLGGVAKTHPYAGKSSPHLVQHALCVLRGDRPLVVAARVVGKVGLVLPSLRRLERSPPDLAVVGTIAKENARAVRSLPPAQRGNVRQVLILLASLVDSDMEVLDARVREDGWQRPSLFRNIGLLRVAGEVDSETAGDVGAIRKEPYHFLEVGGLRLNGERHRLTQEAAHAHGLLEPSATFGGVCSAQHDVHRPGGQGPADPLFLRLRPVGVEQVQDAPRVGGPDPAHERGHGAGEAHVEVVLRRDDHLFEVWAVRIRRHRQMRNRNGHHCGEGKHCLVHIRCSLGG